MSALEAALAKAQRRRYGALQVLVRAQRVLDLIDEGVNDALQDDTALERARDAYFGAVEGVTDAAHDFVEASLAFDEALAAWQADAENTGPKVVSLGECRS